MQLGENQYSPQMICWVLEINSKTESLNEVKLKTTEV